MAKLSEAIKYEIVVKLARYEGYTKIAQDITAEYDVLVSRFQVRSYDPTKPTYAGGEKWRTLFSKERKQYCDVIQDIPISKKAFRMNELMNSYLCAKHAENISLATSILEQAAKESGGMWDRSKNTEPSEQKENSYKHLTPEERKDLVTKMLTDVMSKARSNN